MVDAFLLSLVGLMALKFALAVAWPGALRCCCAFIDPDESVIVYEGANPVHGAGPLRARAERPHDRLESVFAPREHAFV